ILHDEACRVFGGHAHAGRPLRFLVLRQVEREPDLAIVHFQGPFPMTIGTCLRPHQRRKEYRHARATKRSNQHDVTSALDSTSARQPVFDLSGCLRYHRTEGQRAPQLISSNSSFPAFLSARRIGRGGPLRGIVTSAQSSGAFLAARTVSNGSVCSGTKNSTIRPLVSPYHCAPLSGTRRSAR